VVLREVHLWGEESVAVPISAIASIEDRRVCLRVNIEGIQHLPPVPTQHHGVDQSRSTA
jgi:hypothetical protein